MRPREVTVGQDYHGRPYTMTYFHVEEVLASMRTEATLRDHWVDRAHPVFAVQQQPLCSCCGPCEPPCTKAGPNHGVGPVHTRVYLHAMDSDIAIDAQRRMQANGHSLADPKNGVCVVMTGEDKVHGWPCLHVAAHLAPPHPCPRHGLSVP